MNRTPDGLDSIAELWDFNDPAASLDQFDRLAEESDRAGARSYAAEARTQAARCHGLQGRFAEGHGVLDAVASSGIELHDRARVRLLLERGRLVNSGGDPRESAPIFLEALELARRSGDDDLAVDAAHMLGIVEPPEIARGWNEKALEMAASSADPAARRWRASLLNNQGWIFHEAADYDTALRCFEEAVSLRQEAGNVSQIRMAQWTAARCLRSLGRVEQAMSVQAALAALTPDDGHVREELAECLLALGRPDDAQPHFAAAHRLLSQDAGLARSEPERIARLGALGGTIPGPFAD